MTIYSLSVNRGFKCLSLSFGMRLHNQPMHFSNRGKANNVEWPLTMGNKFAEIYLPIWNTDI